MKQSEAAKLVAVLLVAFPSQGSRLSSVQQTTMAEMFADMLSDLSYEQCNAALRVLIQTRQFLPTVAEIRSTALELARGPAPSGGEQWGSVTRAMREKGAWRVPGEDFVFNDPITAKCVQAMNWTALCLSENSVADRARFIELYDKLAGDARREAQAPALAAAREQREIAAGNVSTLALVEGVAKKLVGGS